MPETRMAVVTGRGREASVVAVEDVFVAMDLDDDVAYVAYEDESAIRWDEVSRAEGELMVRMGARAHIHLGSTARIGLTSTQAGVIGPLQQQKRLATETSSSRGGDPHDSN